jgi:hypothetical protein
MPNIPTPEQSKLFAQSVKKWQQVLSLGDWRINISMCVYDDITILSSLQIRTT